MERAAQILAGIFVLVLVAASVSNMFNPANVAETAGFNPTSNYGLTNMRTLGAPTLSIAIITAIGIYRKEWLLVLPAAMYFGFNLTARLISIAVEGFEPVMVRGLGITSALFILALVAVYLFNRIKAETA
jgi:hypothetical protein